MISEQEDFEWKCLEQRLKKEGKVMEWDEDRMDAIARNGNTGEHYSATDMVNQPSHYNQGDIECIDAIKASMLDQEFAGYLKGNVMKYLWRYKSKGSPSQDLAKAEWYLRRLRDEVAMQEVEK